MQNHYVKIRTGLFSVCVTSGLLISSVTLAAPDHMPPGLAKKANVNTSLGHKFGNGKANSDARSFSGRFSSNQRNLLTDILVSGALRNWLNRDEWRAIYQQRNLPPGMANRLAQGKRLPPGIAKNTTYLPSRLYPQIGIPNQYRVGVYGRNVYLYDTLTGIVADVLGNFLR